MARTVLIMRHGKSRWDDPEAADHDRELTGRGKSDARRMGEELQSRGLVPDVIVSSTARRARSTARRVARACGFEGKVRLHAGFYFEGLEHYIEALNGLDAAVRRVLLVGHNPILEELVFHMTGEAVAMPTATLVRVDLQVEEWSQVNEAAEGELCLLLTPRDLP